MAEYVCLDGRMSVNGICPADSYPGYEDPTEDTVTTPVINTKDNDNDNYIIPTKRSTYNATLEDEFAVDKENITTPAYRIRDQLKRDFLEGGLLKDAKKSAIESKDAFLKDLGSLKKNVIGSDVNKSKDFSKDVKSTFQWDFDKAGNKVENFGTTIKNNISEYDNYIENKLGISKNFSKTARTIGVGVGVAKYGAVGALFPFAIPFMAGAALNAEKRKEQYKINQNKMRDEVATIQVKVDNQYKEDKKRDGKDFSVSGPDTSANPTGKSNQASSERGYALHG